MSACKHGIEPIEWTTATDANETDCGCCHALTATHGSLCVRCAPQEELFAVPTERPVITEGMKR